MSKNTMPLPTLLKLNRLADSVSEQTLYRWRAECDGLRGQPGAAPEAYGNQERQTGANVAVGIGHSSPSKWCGLPYTYVTNT